MEFIGKGQLRKRESGGFRSVDYEMRFGDESCLKGILSLQERVADRLPDPEIYRLDSEEGLRERLKHPKSTICVFSENEIVAYCAITFPSAGEDHFGKDLCFTDEELSKSAHLEATAVHPDFRGNSLQRLVSQTHLQVLEGLGIEYVLCTASPKNYYSLRNLFFFQFRIRAMKVKYGWMNRFILVKETRKEPRRYEDMVRLGSERIEQQRALLSAGYEGFQAEREGPEFFILYGR